MRTLRFVLSTDLPRSRQRIDPPVSPVVFTLVSPEEEGESEQATFVQRHTQKTPDGHGAATRRPRGAPDGLLARWMLRAHEVRRGAEVEAAAAVVNSVRSLRRSRRRSIERCQRVLVCSSAANNTQSQIKRARTHSSAFQERGNQSREGVEGSPTWLEHTLEIKDDQNKGSQTGGKNHPANPAHPHEFAQSLFHDGTEIVCCCRCSQCLAVSE